ncbi:alpha/beta hydrolase [Saccharothrix sp. ST-888]|uniref:alpha/beta hydrolase n=1 Tax=Saccharothrix sp. ST-888 TaxID=1427391 RepID=UPI0005EBFDF6|nr:alpha/beta hydrolase [Saccharothrix sp. ST-888]KJK55383.1 alpha/beta hydrolase [Saccharothrix sp. ST-888]
MSKEQRAAVDARLRSAAFDGGLTPDELRKAFEAMMASGPPPLGVTLTPTTLGGRPALEIEPEGGAATGGTILYFHGGAWVFGSPATARNLTAALVRRTGARAVSLDYRLAPEHPFPAAIEDAVAAYRDLLDHGVAAERIVLAGDSAGGGLTVMTLLAARDAGLPLPAAAVAFSPGLDATRSGASMTTKHGIDPLFTRESLHHLGALHLAGQDPRQPLLSPAVYADLGGLPPLLLQAGSNEVLLDDSTRLAARAAAAGVDVILDVTADVPHVFQWFTGVLDEADAALDRAGRFIRDRLPSAPHRSTPH